jgi:hypothetical protein
VRHGVRAALDEVHRGEGGADERRDALERELKDVLGALSSEKRAYDLADRHQLPNRGVAGREIGRAMKTQLGHVANLGAR